MFDSAPLIYSGPQAMPNLSPVWRVFSGFIAMGCLAVLLAAVYLEPNPAGVGTHRGLGMQRCQFLARTNLPCASCGMTTSFAWFVRGNLPASLYVQPFGTLLAAGTAMTFWVALYAAATGKPVVRLLRTIRPRYYYVVPLLAFGIAAWGWKIFIHLRGLDGW